jgi:hypothetical protein
MEHDESGWRISRDVELAVFGHDGRDGELGGAAFGADTARRAQLLPL